MRARMLSGDTVRAASYDPACHLELYQMKWSFLHQPYSLVRTLRPIDFTPCMFSCHYCPRIPWAPYSQRPVNIWLRSICERPVSPFLSKHLNFLNQTWSRYVLKRLSNSRFWNVCCMSIITVRPFYPNSRSVCRWNVFRLASPLMTIL